MDSGNIGFYLWLGLRVIFIGLVVVYVLSGLDDLIVDFTYYIRQLYRSIFRRQLIKPLTRKQLDSVPEKPAVIIVPAWDESAVISKMLLNTASTQIYKNYYIFVGSYPNDEATKLEVEKVREIYPNIEVVVTPADGPTNKADCLNWVYQGILLFEKTHNIHFEFFVFHDAEDVVHPLSLKYFNFLIPRMEFVQIPVFPLEQAWYNFAAGTYMDEFAENHTKDLRARETLAHTLPSAGVGTALSRAAIDYLAKLRKNQIFDISSLTEDYLMGLMLRDMPGKKILLQQFVERTVTKTHWLTGRKYQKRILEPIATREFFPNTFRTAVRQKARWILGIALQGWRAGWAKTLGQNYWLYRDRKAVLTNLIVIVGYVVVGYWVVNSALGLWNPDYSLPPLVESNEIYNKMVTFVMILFGWRVLNRFFMAWYIYSFGQGLLSIPRLFYGNFLNFWATCQAIQRFAVSQRTGKVPAWGKTSHAYPTVDQLRTFHRKLGDLLMERRLISPAQLETAIARQKATGRKLGEILLEMGVLWEEDLVFALAQQQNRNAVEIDAHSTPKELLDLVPRAVAEQYRVFPVGIAGNTLLLATDVMEQDERQKQLAQRLGRSVAFQWTSTPDLQFAIGVAYKSEAFIAKAVTDRLGQRLLRENKISIEALQKALRQQKRTNQKLGEVLVELKLLTPMQLDEELKKT